MILKSVSKCAYVTDSNAENNQNAMKVRRYFLDNYARNKIRSLYYNFFQKYSVRY